MALGLITVSWPCLLAMSLKCLVTAEVGFGAKSEACSPSSP
jgi:hypothetical protein